MVTIGRMKETFKNISDEKRNKIIEASILEFGKNGYKDGSTNRLVMTLGISKGSLFKYFHSKLDLYEYLVDICLGNLLDHMSEFQVKEDLSLSEKILAYAEYEYDYLVANTSEYLFFTQLIKALDNPDLANIKGDLIKKSTVASGQMFDKIDMPTDLELRDHVLLILKGYNQQFMGQLAYESHWDTYKEAYMLGLKSHLKYVKWRL